MVIGGLLNSEDAKVVKKIPLLSSLPIIGEFFKHHSNDNEKRELVILLTPRIVTQDDPAQMSEKMTDWYAEKQYEADQRNLVDVNNPPLPKKVEEKQAKEKEKLNDPNTASPGTRMYERWMEESKAYENGESEQGNIK
jgi:pilus assembly protein CpaC